MSLLPKIDAILQKATKMAEHNNALLLKVKQLETEKAGLKAELENEVAKNEELVNKIKIIKLAQNIGTTDKENADVTELKRKINEYIKEIDHCITMLND